MERTENKKYNLSNIMKKAWKLVKEMGITISEGLKKAWKEAKSVKVKFEKVATIRKAGVQWDEKSAFLTFKLWERYGKRRVYINDYKGRTIGYLEGESNRINDTMGNTLDVIEAAISDFRTTYEF